MMPSRWAGHLYKFNPIWNITSTAKIGDTFEIRMVDIGAKYYRFGEDEYYEKINESLLENAKVVYEVREPEERVYIQNSYAEAWNMLEGSREYGPYYVGNPGLEHTQEQVLGGFLVGNRGLKDSVGKKITIKYDINDSKNVGITDQYLPGNYFGKDSDKNTKIAGLRYKLWNIKTGQESDYKTYDGNILNYRYGRSDAFSDWGYSFTLSQIPHEKDEYFKEIEYMEEIILRVVQQRLKANRQQIQERAIFQIQEIEVWQ